MAHEAEIPIWIADGQDDRDEAVPPLEGVEPRGLLGEGEVLRVLLRGPEHEARVDVRLEPWVEPPDEVAPLMIGGEDRAAALVLRRERLDAARRDAERRGLAERGFTRGSGADQREQPAD